jgi:hypothetical protein
MQIEPRGTGLKGKAVVSKSVVQVTVFTIEDAFRQVNAPSDHIDQQLGTGNWDSIVAVESDGSFQAVQKPG